MNDTRAHCTVVTEPNTMTLVDTPPRRRWPLITLLATTTAVALALAGAAIYSNHDTTNPAPGNGRVLPWIWTSDTTAAPAAGGAGGAPEQPNPSNVRPANPDPTRRANTPGAAPTPTPAVQQPASPTKASPLPRNPPGTVSLPPLNP